MDRSVMTSDPDSPTRIIVMGMENRQADHVGQHVVPEDGVIVDWAFVGKMVETDLDGRSSVRSDSCRQWTEAAGK